MPKVIVERHGPILLVILNRPEIRNAADGETSLLATAAFDELDANTELRVGIITGAGGNFCTGMDLKAFGQGDKARTPGRGLLGITQTPPEKPLIAAVEGWAVAGGLEACLAADLVVAARNARFGIPEVKRGLVATGGGLWKMPRLIAHHIAMEMALTGEPIDAERAERFGLVNRLTEPGEALQEAFVLARQIAANGPLAVMASKSIIARQADWDVDEAYEAQMRIAGHIVDSADAREGAAAFVEKRAPRWQGR
ncbi:crotonase/enoyl-CoA hydratase family protein [Novosphingobium malaysiense]|uniref:Enoyl-CoA hydratase n=1 Tax=Novosphingobium malaysiense TaxID=1348853 RepID=A0A0B1ZIH7_9SPHN|nr:crotonase/enoyl-CoA hydratase family protein [Novosphingobium malaysiense]KHK89078.1 enoyl-CoA hydratase [Novosphingobium malaysiense]